MITKNEPDKGHTIPRAPERPEEFAPGLDPEMQAMADALEEFKQKLKKKENK